MGVVKTTLLATVGMKIGQAGRTGALLLVAIHVEPAARSRDDH
jgi:hypothetical protein